MEIEFFQDITDGVGLFAVFVDAIERIVCGFRRRAFHSKEGWWRVGR